MTNELRVIQRNHRYKTQKTIRDKSLLNSGSFLSFRYSGLKVTDTFPFVFLLKDFPEHYVGINLNLMDEGIFLMFIREVNNYYKHEKKSIDGFKLYAFLTTKMKKSLPFYRTYLKANIRAIELKEVLKNEKVD
jgi:hypothetical protein